MDKLRDWECSCGHKWTAQVVLSEHTQNLSGEAAQFCPKCGKKPLSGSALYSPASTDYEAKPQPETLKAAVSALGLKYEAEFVPWSKSRNAKKPPVKPSDYSLNWKLTITAKNGRLLTTDYGAGIAHIPGYKQAWSGRMTVDEFEALKYACEQGKTARSMGSNLGAALGVKPIPPPALHDVMHSLLLDSDAIDAGSFEEWAADFGYDTDSREAERIYKACVDIALKLRAMLGDSTITALREAAQDY